MNRGGGAWFYLLYNISFCHFVFSLKHSKSFMKRSGLGRVRSNPSTIKYPTAIRNRVGGKVGTGKRHWQRLSRKKPDAPLCTGCPGRLNRQKGGENTRPLKVTVVACPWSDNGRFFPFSSCPTFSVLSR